MMIPKQGAVRDRKWLDHQGTEDCWRCGIPGGTGTVVGAHIRAGEVAGFGRKPDDRLVVPLCSRCHAEQEASPGAEWWLAVFKGRLLRRYQRWGGRAPRSE